MYVMTNYQLIDRMKELLNEPNKYGSGTNAWSNFGNPYEGKWYVDCSCSIKTILWGGRFISANRGKLHAGCNYVSNDYGDLTTDQMINNCKEVSSDFTKIIPGELVYMSGHVGIYIGNGQVIEVSAGFGNDPGCKISNIGSDGTRYKGNISGGKWLKHGKITIIDYGNVPTPIPQTNDFLAPRGYFQYDSNNYDPNNGIGDKSANIAKIAQFMRDTFPLYTPASALGEWYGPNIFAAVKEFQTRAKHEGKYNAEIDGQFGPITLSALRSYGFPY